MSTWGVILLMLCVATGAAWLMQKHVITPILQLTDTMTKLANSDLSVTVDDHNRDNELGEMARTVMVFKQNMIERNRAEQQLSGINEEMNAQLENINQLREQSEDQATKALSLAEGLAVARESAEQAVARARQEELHIRSILNAVHDAIFTINTRGIIESVNPAATIIFGYRFDEMIGQNISMLMTDAIQKHHDVYLERFAEGASQRDVSDPAEQPARHKDGTQITVNVTLNKIILDGEMKIIGVVRDISARKQWEDEIKRLAMTDPLTGLANRNQYNRKLEEAAALSQRLQQPFALLLIDLDKFKPVNDTYGHPVGDALLQHVARILGNSCRDVDTVARLGGDEFAVILASTDKEPDIDTPAQRIIDQLSLPVVIEAHTIQIGASIGISLFPTAATDIEELQRQADLALYQAKADGRGTYRQFSQEITG
jgi:diguanylate cyclase (GGDEF)-like protein/PAS domain S-box-containing protein